MRFFRGMLCVLLAWTLAVAPAMGDEAYYGSYPADDVFITQTIKHTCTLIAATMMLRNFACQRGSPYLQVTETGVRHYSYTKQYGLSHYFRIGQVEVTVSDEIRRVADKKEYLIQCLQAHKEGVVIYDTGAPHAIFLFRYDVDTDTFWCADTIVSRGGKAIRLEDSIIAGADQAAKVNTIDKIWYVVEKRYNI